MISYLQKDNLCNFQQCQSALKNVYNYQVKTQYWLSIDKVRRQVLFVLAVFFSWIFSVSQKCNLFKNFPGKLFDKFHYNGSEVGIYQYSVYQVSTGVVMIIHNALWLMYEMYRM